MHSVEIHKQRVFSQGKMQKVNLFETGNFFCDLYCLCPGQSQRLHKHDDADKIYYVFEGEAVIQVGDEELICQAGQIVLAPLGFQHGVRNDSHKNLTLLVMMAPNPNVRKNS